jgi:hypothetical protein
MDLASVQGRGAEGAARDALAHLERVGGPTGFWIHLDVDVRIARALVDTLVAGLTREAT